MTAKELILAQFPGRVYLPLIEAGAAIGYAEKTCYSLYYKGKFPLPVRKLGRKSMVALSDLVSFMESAGTIDNKQTLPEVPSRRRGRPRDADRDV